MMIKIILALSLILTSISPGFSQSNANVMNADIVELIDSFQQGMAGRNLEIMEAILHPEYRAIVNRMQGQTGTTVISRADYLTLMAAHKIGGLTYKTQINQITVSGHTAMADVLFRSDDALDMHKFLFLVQDDKGNWQLVGDLPIFIQ